MAKKKLKKEIEKELHSALEKIKELEAEVEILKEDKLRLLAEIQNLHKRYEREIVEARKSERKKVVLEIAELIDLTMTAIDTVSKSQDKNLVAGFEMIRSELEKKLRNLGVEIQNPVGEKFDYRYHHAVSVKEDEESNDTILEVIRRGIVFEGEVLRPSLVVVSKKKENS